MGFEKPPQKISKETSNKVANRINRLKEEGFDNFSFEESPDEFIIKFADKSRVHILKMKYLPLKLDEESLEVALPVEDVVEAKVRFRHDSLAEAIAKLKELKK